MSRLFSHVLELKATLQASLREDLKFDIHDHSDTLSLFLFLFTAGKGPQSQPKFVGSQAHNS